MLVKRHLLYIMHLLSDVRKAKHVFDAAIPDLMSHGFRPVHWFRDIGVLLC